MAVTRLLLFRIELDAAHAPTLNEYANMPSWKRARLRTEVDGMILAALPSYPRARMRLHRRVETKWVRTKAGGKRLSRRTIVANGEPRDVLVTRFSSRQPDETSCDVLGGKLPIDRLVHADILRGDSPSWITRAGAWAPAPPGATRVRIEVFACGEYADRIRLL